MKNSAKGRKGYFSVPVVDRFLEKTERPCLDDSACWVWTGAKTSAGHGQVWRDGKTAPAHKVAFELFNGPVANDECVRHKCDNPPCVNPTHLETGTHNDNMRDMVERGRSKAGRAYYRMTEGQVEEARKLFASGRFTYSELAAVFGVSAASMGMAIRGRTWK